jgi:hypothetical protein
MSSNMALRPIRGAKTARERLRRTIAGIPTRRFRTRLSGMAARRQIAIIGVDPAYTSRWGAQHRSGRTGLTPDQ